MSEETLNLTSLNRPSQTSNAALKSWKLTDSQQNTLWWCNFWAGTLHWAGFIITLILYHGKPLNIPIHNQVTRWYNSTEFKHKCDDGKNCKITTQLDVVSTWRLDVLAVLPFAVSGAAHYLYLFMYQSYIQRVKTHQLWWRWLEYAVSAGIMYTTFQLLAGMTEWKLVLANFALQCAMQFVAYATEVLRAHTLPWKACVAVGATFLVALFTQLIIAASDAPSWILALIGVNGGIWACFAIPMLLYFEEVFKYEFTFIVLSLVAKSVLAYWLVASVYMRSINSVCYAVGSSCI